MAKKIRFPLEMKDGIGVRTLEELLDNFDIEKILLNYENGKLITWLNDRYYNDKVVLIEQLDRNNGNFVTDLCKVFGIENINECDNLEDIHERSKRIIKIKKYTDNPEIINKIDQVAFNQEELYDLLDEGKNCIYLCGEKFRVPEYVENITYIGVNEPVAIIETDKIINWKNRNVVFKDIKFDEKYQRLSNNTKVAEAEKLYIAGMIKEAFEIFNQEAENHSGRAMFYLGKYYEEGLGNIREDDGVSKNWYKQGCEAGDVLSKVNYALLLEDSNEKNSIIKECLIELEQLSMTNVVARYELAFIYKVEKGIIDDSIKHLELLESAANDGYWMAMNYLGYYYFYGNNVVQDYSKAIYWTRKAANLGYRAAQSGLAYCYENGIGVSRDVSEAIIWYTKAAEQGDGEAANKMGMAYYKGEGIEKNIEKENEWFLKGAKLGDMEAQYNYAINCRDGYGMQVDLEKAFKYFEMAAIQGKAGAQNEMGKMYLSGEIVSRDYEKAVVWFVKAANQGYADAQNRLAVRYANGQGVEKNSELEFYWYSKAAQQNHEKAIENLKVLFAFNQDCEFVEAIENCVIFTKKYSKNFADKVCEILVAESHDNVRCIYKDVCETMSFATTVKGVHNDSNIILIIKNAQYNTVLHYAKGGIARVIDKWEASMIDEGYAKIMDNQVEYGQSLMGTNTKRGAFIVS